MPDIHPKRIKIHGKYWTLVSAAIPGYDGLAENNPKTTKKHIWINSNTKGIDLLDTIIHEYTHCAVPRWKEDAVLEFASDLAKILWDLGYRSTDLGDED
jgi:hypothetical protein